EDGKVVVKGGQLQFEVAILRCALCKRFVNGNSAAVKVLRFRGLTGSTQQSAKIVERTRQLLMDLWRGRSGLRQWFQNADGLTKIGIVEIAAVGEQNAAVVMRARQFLLVGGIAGRLLIKSRLKLQRGVIRPSGIVAITRQRTFGL